MAEVVLEPLASAAAVLSPDEREIGVALVDIGGGTTDVIIYVDGAVVHTSVIPIGGINLTNDVASGLRTPVAEAERIKMKYGCASTSMVDEDETIEVPSVGGRGPRVLSRRVLAEIIEPRVEEIFQAVRHVVHESGYVDMLASGVVITGGSTLARRHAGDGGAGARPAGATRRTAGCGRPSRRGEEPQSTPRAWAW